MEDRNANLERDVKKYEERQRIEREIEFLEPLQVSILSERRTRQPYGLEGGEPGALARNTWASGETGLQALAM